MQRLLLPFRLGVGGRLGAGEQWFSRIATEDAVRAIAFVLRHEAVVGPVSVVAPNAVTNREFTRALGRALHRPTPFPVPAIALRLVFGRALADELLLTSQHAIPHRLLDAGFEFQYPSIDAALSIAISR